LLVTRPERKGIHVVLSAVIVYRAVINKMLVKNKQTSIQKVVPMTNINVRRLKQVIKANEATEIPD